MVGRKNERDLLNSIVRESSPSLVAIYGRRRVGKTYLIREHFKNQFTFYHTGIANVSLEIQLDNFYNNLKNHYKFKLKNPENWFEAFELLQIVISKSKAKKRIVFIDEMPWMDTPRSNFIQAFEYFWNAWASRQNHLTVIVCGSATMYLENKLFSNTKGLHNRVSHKIKLSPFTLSEVKEFLEFKKINYTPYQILKMYMCVGGIPYYLNAFKRGWSVEQNVDALFFDPNGLLYNEFHHLYTSLFSNAERHIEIIKAIAAKRKGLTREEITKKISISNGGTLSKIIDELEMSDFIKQYYPYGKKSRTSLYQLTDLFSLFYLNYIHKKNISKGSWLSQLDNPSYRAWLGYSFELVALLHVDKVKAALGISGIKTDVCSWVSTNKSEKAQIDILIDRRDDIINIIELKFSVDKYPITKKYEEELRSKMALFKRETKTKKVLHLTFISTYGLKENTYYHTAYNQFSMDILFL
ncbi:MAG: AAA family ATPase [Chitinophagales bacterium]|jgi:AAA+ ATPase superfamily predicted ATPase|nr:ATP-binding protein [Sphingobacteriales bacterium]